MAIYEYKYRGFRGEVGGRLSRVWTVFVSEFLFRMKNMWMVMLLVLTLALGVFPSIMIGSFAVGEGAEVALLGFLGYLFIWSTIFTAVGGGDIFAADRNFNTVTLYFSRPITKEDYFIGKFLSLYVLIALVTLVPCAILSGMIYGLYFGNDSLDFSVEDAAVGFIALGVIWALLFTAIAMMFSSSTKNRWFATAGIFAFIFISALLGELFAGMLHRDAGYLSLTNDLVLLLAHLARFDEAPSYYRWEGALAYLLLLIALCLAFSYYRVKKMDLSE